MFKLSKFIVRPSKHNVTLELNRWTSVDITFLAPQMWMWTAKGETKVKWISSLWMFRAYDLPKEANFVQKWLYVCTFKIVILLLFLGFFMFLRLHVVGTLVAWESPPEHGYAHSGWTISHQELGWYCMCVAEYLLSDLIHFYTHTHASWKWLCWEAWTSDRNAVLHGLKAGLAASN